MDCLNLWDSFGSNFHSPSSLIILMDKEKFPSELSDHFSHVYLPSWKPIKEPLTALGISSAEAFHSTFDLLTLFKISACYSSAGLIFSKLLILKVTFLI